MMTMKSELVVLILAYVLCTMSYVDCYTELPDGVASASVVFNISDPAGENIQFSWPPDGGAGIYGLSSPKVNVSGRLILANLEGTNYIGCSGNPYEGVNVRGPWIALVERGMCTFSQKILLATQANATAILVYDSMLGDTIHMSHQDATDIVSVSISRSYGLYAKDKILDGYLASVDIRLSGYLKRAQLPMHNTSIIFVSLSFLIMLIISMTWLVVYYVQRFRILDTPELIKRRTMVKKVIHHLPKKLLVASDKEIIMRDICPICIESYVIEDSIRTLPCKHVFHRKCVDTWLYQKETCPMCKYNIMKQKDNAGSSRATPGILGALSPSDEILERDQSSPTFVDSLVDEPVAILVIENREEHNEDQQEDLSEDVSQLENIPLSKTDTVQV